MERSYIRNTEGGEIKTVSGNGILVLNENNKAMEQKRVSI